MAEQQRGFVLQRQLSGHTDRITGLQWLPEQHKLLSSALDGSLRLWDVVANKLTHHIEGTSGGWRTLLTATDGGQAVAAHHTSQALTILDLHSGMPLVELNRHLAPVNDLALASDGERFVSVGEDGLIKLWSLNSGMELRTLQRHYGAVQAVAIAPYNHLIVSGGEDHLLYVWDSTDGSLLYTLRAHQDAINTLAISPDGNYIASGAEDSTIRIWHLLDGHGHHILEAHTSPPSALAFSPDGGLLASRGRDGQMYVWRCDSWQMVGRVPQEAGPNAPPHPRTLAFHPSAPVLASVSGDGQTINLWELDYQQLFASHAPQSNHRYTTVKVALVGDSGVGKSALGHRLAYDQFQPTVSTHGQQYWVVERLNERTPDGTDRQIVLWDFAGQADYRLVHSLFLDDIDIALILFDAAERDDFLRGVEYWATQLQQRSRQRPIKLMLVGARLDRGDPWMTDHELEAFCGYHDIQGGYIGTSAMTGRGIEGLLERLQALIDWDAMTTTVTTSTFQRIKDFVLNLQSDPLWQRNHRVLMRPPELQTRLQALAPSFTFKLDDLNAALQHLENHGYVKRLYDPARQPTILLYPERLIKLASAFVLQARAHRRGLGALEEAKLLAGGYDFEELQDLDPAEQKTLLTATASLLIERHVCLRGHSDHTPLLIFPTLIHQKRPYIKGLVLVDDVTYRVQGSEEYLYAALVVQISYASEFIRAHFWQNQAQFQMGLGEICGFRVESVSEGQVDLVLYYGVDATDYTRLHFKTLFERILRQTDTDYTRYPRAYCPDCNSYQPREVMIDRIMSTYSHMHCLNCGQHIDLSDLDAVESLTPQSHAILKREQERTRLQTAFEVAMVHIKSTLEPGKPAPSAFISYAWGERVHELWVARLAKHLASAGINIEWDRWHNANIGQSLPRFVSRLEKTDFVIVVGTPLYRDKYENKNPKRGTVVAAEVDLINLRMVTTEDAKDTVLPVLLEGQAEDAFPPLLRGRIFADFREERFYFVGLFKLLLTLYGLSPRDPVIGELQDYMLEKITF